MDWIELVIEFIKSLSPENWLLIVSFLFNFILIFFKLKGSPLEKAYKKAIKKSIIDDYYIVVDGKSYDLKDVHFERKEETL